MSRLPVPSEVRFAIEKIERKHALSRRMLVAVREGDDEAFQRMLGDELAAESLKESPMLDGEAISLLAEAIRQGKPTYIDLICRKGVHPDDDHGVFECGVTPLYQAIELLLTLYGPGSPYNPDTYDVVKIFTVAQCVEKLIQHGASLDTVCPMMDESCIDLLASRGCDESHPLTHYLQAISNRPLIGSAYKAAQLYKTAFIETLYLKPDDHRRYTGLVAAVVSEGLFASSCSDGDDKPTDAAPLSPVSRG